MYPILRFTWFIPFCYEHKTKTLTYALCGFYTPVLVINVFPLTDIPSGIFHAIFQPNVQVCVLRSQGSDVILHDFLSERH